MYSYCWSWWWEMFKSEGNHKKHLSVNLGFVWWSLCFQLLSSVSCGLCVHSLMKCFFCSGSLHTVHNGDDVSEPASFDRPSVSGGEGRGKYSLPHAATCQVHVTITTNHLHINQCCTFMQTYYCSFLS